MALRALVKSEASKAHAKSSVVQLYRYYESKISVYLCTENVCFRTPLTHLLNLFALRSILKEIPRVLTLYDVDMPIITARTAVAYQFRKNGYLKDGRYCVLSYYGVLKYNF